MAFLKLTLKEIKQKIWLAIGFYVIFAVFHKTSNGGIYMNEIMFFCHTMITASLLWSGEDEKDFILISKMSLKNVFLVRFFVLYLALTLLPALHVIIFGGLILPLRDSLLINLVSSLLMCSLGALVRTLTKNNVSALIFGAAVDSVLLSPQVFLKLFGFSSERANAIMDVVKSENLPLWPLWSVGYEGEALLINRLCTFGYSAVVLIITYLLLLRQEKVKKLNKKEKKQ